MKTSVKTIWILIMLLFSNLAESMPTHIIISSSSKFVVSGNAVLTVTGNLTVNGIFSTSGTSTVKFSGTTLQQIGGNSGVSTFQNVEFNNPANFKLLGDVTVNGITTLTNGIVSTGTKILILPSTAAFSPATGSATSFIDGKIKKTGNGSAFTFPVGDVQGATIVWEPLQIEAYNNTNDFTVHFTYKSPYDSLGINTWSSAYFAPTIHNVSDKEFWLIDRTGTGTQVPNVTLYWKDAVKSDILGNAIPNSNSTTYDADALTDLTLVHWNGTKWDDMGGTATGTWPIGQITNSTAFSNYSPITFGSKTGKNPLPIELVSFSADCNKQFVQLHWETASEINNNFFTVEKSIDAINWQNINTIAGQGNSNQLHTYNVTLNEVEGYYRLKQTDFNGEFTYSNIIQTSCQEGAIEIINVFPNPAHNYFSFVVCSIEDREIYIKIEDILGQIIINSTETITKGINNKTVDVSKLAPATYYFSIVTANNKHCENKQILIK